MCILILTTEHPDYPLVLLLNRDEYFKRPTARAAIRVLPNGAKILLPLDLARPEHGTWIGVSDNGKIAVLVNFSEKDDIKNVKLLSRGLIPVSYLSSGDKTEDEWLEKITEEFSSVEKKVSLRDIGGFLLLYGKLNLNENKRLERLHVMSNRGDRGVVHEAGNGEGIQFHTTFGLLNSLYLDPWPKVKLGEKLLLETVSRSVNAKETKDEFIESCFNVLSTDLFDPEVARDPNNDFESKKDELKKSIFIPPVHTGFGSSNSPVLGEYYGTRTQTVVLIDKKGTLFYVERTLHEHDEEEPEFSSQTFELKLKL